MSDKVQSVPERGGPFWALLHFNLPYKWQYLAGASLALCFTVIQLGIPLIVREAVHFFTTESMTVPILMVLFCGLIGISLLAGLARYGERVLMIGASRMFEFDLRNTYFRHVQSLSQTFFHKYKTGDVMARATNDLNYVRLFIGPGIMGTVDLMRVPFALAILIYLNPRLTGISLLPVPILFVVVYFFVSYSHRQSKKVQDQFGNVTSGAQENMAGARVVKAFSIAERQVKEFRQESHHYMLESVRLAAVTSLIWPCIELMISIVVLMVFWFGGAMVIQGAEVTRPLWQDGRIAMARASFGIDDLSAFILVLVMLVFPLTGFGWVVTLYQRGAAAMARILAVLREEPEIKDGAGTRLDIESIHGDVEFNGVSFTYEEGAAVLTDVNLTAHAGQTIAIVGPTGSGKSSIVNLLVREYDTTGGTVLVDGVDVREIPLGVLRGSIGYVPQDGFLFSDTVRENMMFGKPGATDEMIEQAADIAQFSEVVKDMPNGYDTLLGERGVNLSGGQKQRLTIARAVLREPAILVLDDSLSSVDTHTEERILEKLKAFMANRTSIIISHRISTVQDADMIYVVDSGKIIEQGVHEDLVAAGGLYADMHQRQLLEAALEGE